MWSGLVRTARAPPGASCAAAADTTPAAAWCCCCLGLSKKPQRSERPLVPLGSPPREGTGTPPPAAPPACPSPAEQGACSECGSTTRHQAPPLFTNHQPAPAAGCSPSGTLHADGLLLLPAAPALWLSTSMWSALVPTARAPAGASCGAAADTTPAAAWCCCCLGLSKKPQRSERPLVPLGSPPREGTGTPPPAAPPACPSPAEQGACSECGSTTRHHAPPLFTNDQPAPAAGCSPSGTLRADGLLLLPADPPLWLSTSMWSALVPTARTPAGPSCAAAAAPSPAAAWCCRCWGLSKKPQRSERLLVPLDSSPSEGTGTPPPADPTGSPSC